MNIETEQVAFQSEGLELTATLFLPGQPGRHPVVIVCHGAGEFKENHFHMCRLMAESGVAALALDMRGHGASDGPRFCVRIRDWVADLRSALDYLQGRDRIDGERIGAFGFSSGGTAVLEAALDEPRLRTLILLAPTVRNSLPLHYSRLFALLVWWGRIVKRLTGREMRLSVIKALKTVKLVADEKVRATLLADPVAMEAFRCLPFPGVQDAFFVDTIRRVARVKVPTLVLWGEQDDLDPSDTAEMLYERLTCEKQLFIVPGNGHAGHLDRNRSQVFSLSIRWAQDKLA